jgi:hypothetical protein
MRLCPPMIPCYLSMFLNHKTILESYESGNNNRQLKPRTRRLQKVRTAHEEAQQESYLRKCTKKTNFERELAVVCPDILRAEFTAIVEALVLRCLGRCTKPDHKPAIHVLWKSLYSQAAITLYTNFKVFVMSLEHNKEP